MSINFQISKYAFEANTNTWDDMFYILFDQWLKPVLGIHYGWWYDEKIVDDISTLLMDIPWPYVVEKADKMYKRFNEDSLYLDIDERLGYVKIDDMFDYVKAFIMSVVWDDDVGDVWLSDIHNKLSRAKQDLIDMVLQIKEEE